MAPHIDDVPAGVTGAGQDFDYTDPPRLSAVVLVNAPLDPDHVNVGVNRAAYDTFIAAEVTAGRAYSADDLNVQSPEADLILPVPYEEAAEFYNYGRLVIDGRAWYVFYTPVYQNKTSTRMVADIDEFASYSWSLGYSQIERGHVAVAASQNDTYGATYLTAPEPIDAPPVRGVLSAGLLGAAPDEWTVMVVSANDLRGGSGFPYFDRHVNADLIDDADNLATIATIKIDGTIQTQIPEADYPWRAYTNPGGPSVIDTISPGHTVTNPGHTIPSGWEWHIVNNGGRGGVDWNYDFETFTAPAPGTVDHFDVAGVGMVVRLTLDTPAQRTSPRQPHGDQPGPIVAIWFQHCSAAVDGHHEEGEVIGTSGDGYGAYAPHLHVHAATDHSKVSGSGNRSNFWGFLNGGSAPSVVDVFIPKVTASPLSTIDGVAAGGGVYLFTLAGFAEYMTIMQGAAWVTSGITDIRLIPSWAVGGGGDATFDAQRPSRDPSDDSWTLAAGIPNYVENVVTQTALPSVLDDWRDSVLATFNAEGWTKLVTSQFTDLLVSNGEGGVSFKPEQWQHPDVAFEAVTGAAHGDPSIRLIPDGYNQLARTMGIDTPVGGAAGLMHSGYSAAAAQVAGADMTPWMSGFSSYQTWIVNKKNRDLAIELALTGIQLNAGVQGINTVLGAASSAAGGAISGGAPGAIAGAASGAIGAIGGLATAGVTASNQITMLDISQDGSFDIGAFQLGLSGEAAVNSFNAWNQSLDSASGGGTPHHLASAWRAILQQAFRVVIVVPSAERIKKLLSEWRRYGYMIGQAFDPGRLDPMTKMSYWQTTDATILGAVPQQRRQTIAGAFNRGVTVWTNVADIGTDVTATNEPRSGISY